MATSKANVDPTFEVQIRALRDAFKAAAEGTTSGGKAPWVAPALLGWSGVLSDREGMAKAFDRSGANGDAKAALSDPSDPGTEGDVIASAVQAHYLGTMERAYRLRHLRGVRAAVLSAGRQAALGDNRGPLVRCALEQVRDLLARAKA